MKKFKRSMCCLSGLVLAFLIMFSAIPARASWVDELWDVYSELEEYRNSDSSSEYQDDAEEADPDSAENKNSTAENKQNISGDEPWDGTGDPESLLDVEVEEDGEYTSKWEVAAYIHEYEELPSNFITKKEAEELGWVSSEGNLDEAAPGKSIGGGQFGNYEGSLPEKKGRSYYECDIDYEGGYRNSKRLVYSDDGLIFYTEDHYETFEQLWPED